MSIDIEQHIKDIIVDALSCAADNALDMYVGSVDSQAYAVGMITLEVLCGDGDERIDCGYFDRPELDDREITRGECRPHLTQDRRRCVMTKQHMNFILEAMAGVKEEWQESMDVAGVDDYSFAEWIDDDFAEFQEQMFGVLENFDDPDDLGSMNRDLRNKLIDYPKQDYMALAHTIQKRELSLPQLDSYEDGPIDGYDY